MLPDTSPYTTKRVVPDISHVPDRCDRTMAFNPHKQTLSPRARQKTRKNSGSPSVALPIYPRPKHKSQLAYFAEQVTVLRKAISKLARAQPNDRIKAIVVCTVNSPKNSEQEIVIIDCIITKSFGFFRAAFMAQQFFASLSVDAVHVLCVLYGS